MSLTFSHGPLAKRAPETVNYRIEGKERRLFLDDFPRRVRALFGGETVLDSDRGKLLHETGLLPQLYVPEADLRTDLLTPTDHSTHCPYKGDASYWTLRAGDQVAENAVWAYPEPLDDAGWLRGYRALYFEAMGAWFDEDEEITGHLRDPYHRVDVRASSRRVRVLAAGEVVADTSRPMVLSETGLPNRYYIPEDDVLREALEPSATHTICPYKGTASYYSVRVGGQRLADTVWYYPQPLENVLKAAGHLCFLGDGIELEADGERVG